VEKDEKRNRPRLKLHQRDSVISDGTEINIEKSNTGKGRFVRRF